jgi:hypothetical protein
MLASLIPQDANVRFFGAHTLTVKISRDWNTLPEEHWSGLKEAILGWLCESARAAYPPPGAPSTAGERVVFRKLAVAVGLLFTVTSRGFDFAISDMHTPHIQVTSLSFRLVPNSTWPNWLLETILRLTASGCSRLGIYEFLTLAIEEIGRADLVGAKRYVDEHADGIPDTLYHQLIPASLITEFNMIKLLPMLRPMLPK